MCRSYQVIICDYDVCHQSFADRHSFRSHVFTVSLTVAFWKSQAFKTGGILKLMHLSHLQIVWSFRVYIYCSVILVIFLLSDSNLLHYIRINLRLKLSKAASLISSASGLSSFSFCFLVSFSFFCISSASFRKIFEGCRCPQVTDSVRNTLLQCQIYAAEKKHRN